MIKRKTHTQLCHRQLSLSNIAVIISNASFILVMKDELFLFSVHTTHKPTIAYDRVLYSRQCFHGYEDVCHRDRTYKAMLPVFCCLNIQWGEEFPGDSSIVSQEAEDKFGLNMLSLKRHA